MSLHMQECMSEEDVLRMLGKVSPLVKMMCADLHQAMICDEVGLTDAEEMEIGNRLGQEHDVYGGMSADKLQKKWETYQSGLDKVKKYLESRYQLKQ